MNRALRKYILLSSIIFAAFISALPAQQRAVPDSVVKKMQKQKEFRYANDSSYWLEEKQEQRESNFLERFVTALARSAFLKIILYVFLIAGILFAVYQVLIVNNFFTFSKRRKLSGGKQGAEAENILEHLDEKLQGAIDSHNYRHAVRFLYLKTLRNLSEKQFIVLNAKSTNKDYVKQMSNYKGRNAFTNLTRIYEYVWYGDFTPDEIQFDVIRKNFDQFSAER